MVGNQKLCNMVGKQNCKKVNQPKGYTTSQCRPQIWFPVLQSPADPQSYSSNLPCGHKTHFIYTDVNDMIAKQMN